MKWLLKVLANIFSCNHPHYFQADRFNERGRRYRVCLSCGKLLEKEDGY